MADDVKKGQKTTESNEEATETSSEQESTQESVEETQLTEEEIASAVAFRDALGDLGSPDEIKQSVEFYKALQTDKGPQIVKNLAKAMGITPDTSKREVQRKVRSTKDIVKEKLPDEYAFLADHLGDVMEAVIEEKINPSINEISMSSVEKTYDETMEDLLGSLSKSQAEKVENKMRELGEIMPIAPGQVGKIREYLTNLFNLATTDIELDTKKITKARKIRKNLEDAEPSSSDIAETRVRKGPEKPTHRQAIEAAARGEKWE